MAGNTLILSSAVPPSGGGPQLRSCKLAVDARWKTRGEELRMIVILTNLTLTGGDLVALFACVKQSNQLFYGANGLEKSSFRALELLCSAPSCSVRLRPTEQPNVWHVLVLSGRPIWVMRPPCRRKLQSALSTLGRHMPNVWLLCWTEANSATRSRTTQLAPENYSFPSYLLHETIGCSV